MMINRDGHLLHDRIATGLRPDRAAVQVGLTLPHSSGAVEGTVNMIEFLKRQVFGCADLDLLRARVFHCIC